MMDQDGGRDGGGGREVGREGGKEGTRAKPGNQLVLYNFIMKCLCI